MDQIQFFYPEFISKKHEFDSIYTLRFQKPANLNFIAGQWAHLGINTPEPDKSMVRHMSFSSSPDDDYLEFTMDLGSGSNYKNALANLQPGDKVRAFKIKGEFIVLPNEKRELIFLCGGLGITPVRSLIKKLSADNSPLNWHLIHVARTEFLYKNELSTFSGKQTRIHREELDALWPEIISNNDRKVYYLCGSQRFLDGMTTRLSAGGISADQIVTESFK